MREINSKKEKYTRNLRGNYCVRYIYIYTLIISISRYQRSRLKFSANLSIDLSKLRVRNFRMGGGRIEAVGNGTTRHKG